MGTQKFTRRILSPVLVFMVLLGFVCVSGASAQKRSDFDGTWENLLLDSVWGVYEFDGPNYRYWMVGQVDKEGKPRAPDTEGAWEINRNSFTITEKKVWGMDMSNPDKKTYFYTLEGNKLTVWERGKEDKKTVFTKKAKAAAAPSRPEPQRQAAAPSRPEPQRQAPPPAKSPVEGKRYAYNDLVFDFFDVDAVDLYTKKGGSPLTSSYTYDERRSTGKITMPGNQAFGTFRLNSSGSVLYFIMDGDKDKTEIPMRAQ